MSKQQVGRYELSETQAKMLRAIRARIQAAAQMLEPAKQDAERQRELYEAKLATVQSGERNLAMVQDVQRLFISYIVQEFELPPSKNDSGWNLNEQHDGKFVLTCELAPEAIDDAPQAPADKVVPIQHPAEN